MPARRDDVSIPAWSRDQLGSVHPPELEPPYFDTELEAWVLSRHADVLAAFHASSLVPKSTDANNFSESSDDSAWLRMRAETSNALSTARLRPWRESLTDDACSCADTLPDRQPVDLIAAYARPLCHRFAATVTGVSPDDAENLEDLARVISAATSAPENQSLVDAAKSATAKLRTYFPSGPEPMRDSGFVALSQTLPCILGNSWYALAQWPNQWSLLHGHPQLIDQAIEELLRYAGPVRILSRTATTDIYLNDTLILRGDRILLRIFAANHDPERFDRATEFSCTRHDTGHFTFGAGAHACVAANLIRMAVKTMTVPLLQRFVRANPVRDVDWQGGSIYRFPASLWVSLDAN